MGEFSFRSRQRSLKRFREETFDLLIIGGGITGAATARDAATRGLKVALVERGDFASGTSSRSSKMVHGGLRYLENFEIGLVFEALSERTLLLKTAPHMVRPLPFYWPVYSGDPHGRGILWLGLWLYDLLSLFRAPGYHKGLSKRRLLEEIPFLSPEGLAGGFSYFDASMWDDALVVQTLASAYELGGAIANYTEAVRPFWKDGQVAGFSVRDVADKEDRHSGAEFELRAHRTVICAGPWTDELGSKLSSGWNNWLMPSKGVHLVFDLKRIPIPGAMVMNHPEDGRISFVIPRPDYGAGIVIVGTTDGPTPADPAKAEIAPADVQYLMRLLNRYFPSLKLSAADIISAYVGVRPLMAAQVRSSSNLGEPGSSGSLQKISREHHIDRGPGGTVLVAGGKYTTHRLMGREVIDFALKTWKEDLAAGKASVAVPAHGPSQTEKPVNPHALPEAITAAHARASELGLVLAPELVARYGAEALEVVQADATDPSLRVANIEGFPCLLGQLRHSIRNEMVIHLQDFSFRRAALFMSRADHGLPWVREMSRTWATETGVDDEGARREAEALEAEVRARCEWQTKV